MQSGKGFVTLTGDVGAVRAAVEAARGQDELYVESTVIPRPSPSGVPGTFVTESKLGP